MKIVSSKSLVDAAKAEITTLDRDTVARMRDEDTCVLIDIRDIRELEKEGRIPGAVHAPRGMLEFWVDPESPYHRTVFATDKTLVLFCAAAWRSALAAKTLQDMGLTTVAEMAGGFSAWKSENRDVDLPPSDDGSA